MHTWQHDVCEFHRRSEQPAPRRPTPLPPDRAELRRKLITEESSELWDAIDRGSLPEIARGVVDVIYVAIGTAVECGIDIGPVWGAVHRAKLSKLADPVVGDDGKIGKGTGYQPARIAPIIDRQRSGGWV